MCAGHGVGVVGVGVTLCRCCFSVVLLFAWLFFSCCFEIVLDLLSILNRFGLNLGCLLGALLGPHEECAAHPEGPKRTQCDPRGHKRLPRGPPRDPQEAPRSTQEAQHGTQC